MKFATTLTINYHAELQIRLSKISNRNEIQRKDCSYVHLHNYVPMKLKRSLNNGIIQP